MTAFQIKIEYMQFNTQEITLIFIIDMFKTCYYNLLNERNVDSNGGHDASLISIYLIGFVFFF